MCQLYKINMAPRIPSSQSQPIVAAQPIAVVGPVAANPVVALTGLFSAARAWYDRFLAAPLTEHEFARVLFPSYMNLDHELNIYYREGVYVSRYLSSGNRISRIGINELDDPITIASRFHLPDDVTEHEIAERLANIIKHLVFELMASSVPEDRLLEMEYHRPGCFVVRR